MDCHHPTVYKLISHFRIEQENIGQCVARFLAGEVKEDANKAKYVQLSRRLNALMPTYGNRPLLDFLRAVSQNLTLYYTDTYSIFLCIYVDICLGICMHYTFIRNLTCSSKFE